MGFTFEYFSGVFVFVFLFVFTFVYVFVFVFVEVKLDGKMWDWHLIIALED